MKKKRADFTLLEVLVALVILATGLGLFMGQFALAANRVREGAAGWRQTHELTQAAEYLLLAGPGSKLDRDFFDDDYRIRYEYVKPELPDDRDNLVGNMELMTLKVWLEAPGGDKLDELNIDCWKGTNVIAEKE